MTSQNVLEKAKQLLALADVGLLYSKNEYDKERYAEIQQLSLQLLSGLAGTTSTELQTTFPLAPDYPTAKVDVRALMLSPENELLLVQESADGRWSLPGGWADVGYSPKESAVKECKEETGLDVAVVRLLAVFDKRLHAHPPQPFYVYKMVFLCTPISTTIAKGFDVLDVRYFKIDQLPELSEDRILKSQIELVYQKAMAGDRETYVD